jgi:hypothetical protein
MVPLLRIGLQTPPIMQGSWSDDNIGMPKAMVESSKGVDNELVLKVLHDITTNEAIDINDISKP